NRTMKEGSWIFFGSSYIRPSVSPGRSVELRLESLAPPGLVECKCSVTGGVFGMKGAGEEMPQELENILPGYEIWPRGYTVVENLKSLSRTEHCKYLLERLSQFQSLGWMNSNAR